MPGYFNGRFGEAKRTNTFINVKLSPLFFASIAIVAYGFYYTLSGMGGTLVGLGVIVILAAAISVFLIHLGITKALEANFRKQILVEAIIIAFCFLLYFLVWLAEPTEM